MLRSFWNRVGMFHFRKIQHPWPPRGARADLKSVQCRQISTWSYCGPQLCQEWDLADLQRYLYQLVLTGSSQLRCMDSVNTGVRHRTVFPDDTYAWGNLNVLVQTEVGNQTFDRNEILTFMRTVDSWPTLSYVRVLIVHTYNLWAPWWDGICGPCKTETRVGGDLRIRKEKDVWALNEQCEKYKLNFLSKKK